MNTSNKILSIAFLFFAFFFNINWTKAQEEEKKRTPGYVYKTTSTCPDVTTTGNTMVITNAQGVTAKDDTDVRANSNSCLQQAEVHISIKQTTIYQMYLHKRTYKKTEII